MWKIALVKLVTRYLGVTKIISFELVFSLLFVNDLEIIGGPQQQFTCILIDSSENT